MCLDALVESLLRRHFHRAVTLSYTGILTPAQQTAYYLDTLVQVLVKDAGQHPMISCQDSPHPKVKGYVYPLACLVLLEVDVVIAVAQPAVHGFIDALVVRHALTCQASNCEDVLGLVQQLWSPACQLVTHIVALCIVRGQPQQPLDGLVILKVRFIHLLHTLVCQIHILHIYTVSREASILKIITRCQLHLLGCIQEYLQILHMLADGVWGIRPFVPVLVRLLQKEPAPVIIEVQRHVVEVYHFMALHLISLQLCLGCLVALDGAWSDGLGTLLLQSFATLALPDILIYPSHQRHTLHLSLFLLSLLLLTLHLFYYILTKDIFNNLLCIVKSKHTRFIFEV